MFQSLFLDIRIKDWRQCDAKSREYGIASDVGKTSITSTVEIRI